MSKIFQQASLFEVRYIDEAGGCERPHTHASLVISAVSGGNLVLQINNDEITCQKETLVIIGSNTRHCVQAYSSDFTGVYILEVFEPPPFCSGFSLKSLQMFSSQLLHNAQIYNEFIELCLALLSPIPVNKKNKLLSIWLNDIYKKYYLSDAKSSIKTDLHSENIKSILNMHTGEKPPFNEISRHCGLSKERCNRLFRNTYNISIQGYFLNQKALHAKTLLLSNQSLSNIALECGFYDQSHLSRVFKNIYQIAPAKYRVLVKNECQSHTRDG